MNYTNIIKNDVKMYAVFENQELSKATDGKYFKLPVPYIGITDNGEIAPLTIDTDFGFDCPIHVENFVGFEFPDEKTEYSDTNWTEL